ncbi:MAG: hypothetical protein K2F57_07485 [Candidatus Gastranaerophilales bacterium]|nr:hypothetical protein [Candidatus Gastranaerophilales bacterium]
MAEVLITLGIIGVVAAITIPGLITAYKAHVLKTSFLKTYSTLHQAIRRMEDDEVPIEQIFTSLKNYITGATFCGAVSNTLYGDKNGSSCFNAQNGLYKTITGKSTIPASLMDDSQYILADGTNIMFEWDSTHFSDGSHLWLFADINGYKNPPNRAGYDLFVFQIIDGKFLTFGDKETRIEGTYITPDTHCNPKGSGAYYNGFGCAHRAKSEADYFKWAIKNIK